MEKLKEYKTILLSGIGVMVFFVAACFIVGNAEPMDSQYTYAEHIFQADVVNEIDIAIDEADWQEMLENPLEEEYYKANVTINGETVGNVAIRTKGNNTLTSVASSDSDRYSLKIDFDYYDDNGNYHGLKKLCLNNNYGDSSYMREYISYEILEEMGIPTPGHAYSIITINGEEWGLYLAVEAIDEVFLATHFDDATGDLYKPDGTGADLVYRGDDLSQYTGLNLKTNEETSDGSAILALLKALENGEDLENVLDIDETLRYLAVNVALANYDSYLGNTTHNYYLYEQDGVFSILPWDYNYSFGGFGGGEVDIYEPANNSMGGGGRGEKQNNAAAEETDDAAPAMENAQMPETPEGREMPEGNGEMPDGMELPDSMERPEGMEMGGGMPSMGGSDDKPLVDTLLEQEAFLALYEEYLQEIAENYLTEEYMAAMVTKVHDLIAPYVEQDATAFYTYEEFEQACSVDPEDEYSLVYYAVNMAESILNQLAGGEPTFNVSSLKGGGMGGGGKGGDRAEPAADGEGMTPSAGMGGEKTAPEGMGGGGKTRPEGMGGEKTAPGGKTGQGRPEMPQQAEGQTPPEMPQQTEGQTPPEMPQQTEGQTPPGMPQQTEGQTESTEQTNEQTAEQQELTAFGNDKGGVRPNGGGHGGGMPGMPGEHGRQQVDIKECIPAIAVCGGAFVVGVVVLISFKRKKELKPPKGE